MVDCDKNLERRVEELEDRLAHRCQCCTCPDFTVPTRRLTRLKERIREALKHTWPAGDPVARIRKLLDEDDEKYRES